MTTCTCKNGRVCAHCKRRHEENAAYMARCEAFVVEAIELCKKHGICMQAGANALQFAIPPEYTQEQLEAAFKLVQPAENWKNPINAQVYLDDAEKEVIGEAVIYFTGGLAEFVPVPRAKKVNGKTRYRVIAPGYYRSVGA